ncbi:MAG: NAD-dependent epimerase/dehydratase family protein [Victivallaceae bacterium]|nr:NAD-dependent epimerase/dehydratase family protein [Victivallaceae bacterium]
MKVGITGCSGFLGSHLLGLLDGDRRFETTAIGRDDFKNDAVLAEKCRGCDAIVHFAGLSRHDDGDFLYQVNVGLAGKLVAATRKTGTWLLLSSTTHIDKELAYHASKRECERIFAASGNPSTALLIANAFGSGSRPFYNSVVSTFCHLAARNQCPERINDVMLKIVHVDDVVERIAEILLAKEHPSRIVIGHRFEIPLPLLWAKLEAMASGRPVPNSCPEIDNSLSMTLESYKSSVR